MTAGERTRSVVLARRPDGNLTVDCLPVVTTPVPPCEAGQVLVRTEYLSCDPYLRLRMQDTFEVGAPVPARAVGRVLVSNDRRWSVGDRVWGPLAWSENVIADAGTLQAVDPALQRASHALSVCGAPGLTAYVGMVEKARPVVGDQVVVSGASGAIGSIAGQLARQAGAHVVGIVGTEHKARHLVEELGFDQAVVRGDPDLLAGQLARAIPGGIDVCFENVGGSTLDASLANLRPAARVVLCGMVSAYDAPTQGVHGLMGLCAGEATVQGLNVGHHLDRLPVFAPYMADLLRRGEVTFREDVVLGIDLLPAAFLEMLAGGSVGKRLVQVDP